MDAYQLLTKLDISEPLTQAGFDALVVRFRKVFLEEKRYTEKLVAHRRPQEFLEELRREVADRLQAIQQRPEMRDFDGKTAGCVPSVVKQIWIEDKNLRTCFAALEGYCQLRGAEILTTGFHLAEYKAMDRLFRLLSRSPKAKTLTVPKPTRRKTSIGFSSRYYEPFMTLSRMVDADHYLPTRYNEDKETTSFAYLYGNYQNDLEPVGLSQLITTKVAGYLRDNLFRPDEIKLLLQELLPQAQLFGERAIKSMRDWSYRAAKNNDTTYASEVQQTITVLLASRNFIYQDLLEQYSSLYNDESKPQIAMKSKAEIQEMVLDFFRRTNNRAGHVVHMNVFRHNLLHKLNPKEQELFLTGVNELIEKGYLLYEASGPECLRLTEKGYDRIYDDNFQEEESLPVIQKKQLPGTKLPDELYTDVLSTLSAYGRDLETKPRVYIGQDEEGLRDHFLTVLGSRYERTTATGETFNRQGKTDILLKDDQGHNLFIAECKWWKGPVVFHSTISQLFDNYVTWRDTKLAVLFFVDNKDFSNVLSQIKSEAEQHPYYLSFLTQKDDTSFSFIFRQKDDAAHEVKLEIMLFHFVT